jgi:dihydrolipoamide dehydrogenase
VRGAQLGLKVALSKRKKARVSAARAACAAAFRPKQLLNAAHLIRTKPDISKEFGLKVEGLSFDFAVQKYKSDIVNEKLGGRFVFDEEKQNHGFQRLRQNHGQRQNRSRGEDGKKETVETKNIIIATGSVVKPFPGFETDGKQVVNSDQILELEKVPKSMLVMGSGAVGVEFASVYSRFGCETTVIEFMPRIVPVEDEEVSKELARAFKKRGIKSKPALNRKARKIENRRQSDRQKRQRRKRFVLKPKCFSSPSANALSRKSRLGKHQSRRQPARHVKVNEYCETDEPGIFAIGDVIDTAWLAHLASKEGILVVERSRAKKSSRSIMRLVPNCTYCDPEVASVGLTEAKAREEGYDVKVGKFPFRLRAKRAFWAKPTVSSKSSPRKNTTKFSAFTSSDRTRPNCLAEACVAMRSKRPPTKTPKRWRIFIFVCIFILSSVRENGFMMESLTKKNESKQLRPGLWATVNERYPGSMITKKILCRLAKLKKPLSESRLTFVSTAGVQPKGTLPFDTVHPVGDYTFAVCLPIQNRLDLEIHQLKYPTVGAERDLNVIFPIERLQELQRKNYRRTAPNFFRLSVTIWTPKCWRKRWRKILPKRSKRKARMLRCSRPPDRFAIRASRSCSAPSNEEEFRLFQ